ncbi:MAG: universal stress protein [Gemmatimonadetes bacterium]|nr:universal stress protein [Gemmatimonadota bacterium]
MAHVSHKLGNSFEGALAGGGDPASSPLYVFGPFLRLIVVGGVASVTFGASIWMVVFTVAMVSAMYRLVMRWVVDGSGGSGLAEEEFGSWAAKLNAGITFVEYTLTFLVSMAALVTFMADRYQPLAGSVAGLPYRTLVAVALSVLIGWLVNRGPKVAARAFGPATLGVLALLWTMIIATIWNHGLHLPQIDLRAFTGEYLHFTLGGYVRILALMTGIEVFANLVAAYRGSEADRSRKAFGSLMIVMGTTCLTMLIVGPAILDLADPTRTDVSVFTQTMDQILPAPLAYAGTLIGVLVLGSAAAASAQGLQNLALGLRYRNYIPARIGQRNRFDVADTPVWIQVAISAFCFFAFGTHEETYLAIYAAGVFILLSMTGWAASKRLLRQLREEYAHVRAATLGGTVLATLLTSMATVLIFEERFFEGAWTYLLFLPVLYGVFSFYRRRLGPPMALDDHLGRFFVGQYLLPYQRAARVEDDTRFERIVVPLDGSTFAEHALDVAETMGRAFKSEVTLVSVVSGESAAATDSRGRTRLERSEVADYLVREAARLEGNGIESAFTVRRGAVAEEVDNLADDMQADLIVLATHGRSGVERMLLGSMAHELVRITDTPLLLVRPTDRWTSRSVQFRRLLVSLDGSEGAEAVLRFVRALARRFESEIVLLSVPEKDTEKETLERYLTQVATALQTRGYKCRVLITGSTPARTIVEAAMSERADLIVMATRGRGARETDSDLGTVTDRVVQHTQVPVMVVPIRRTSVNRTVEALQHEAAVAATPADGTPA